MRLLRLAYPDATKIEAGATACGSDMCVCGSSPRVYLHALGPSASCRCLSNLGVEQCSVDHFGVIHRGDLTVACSFPRAPGIKGTPNTVIPVGESRLVDGEFQNTNPWFRVREG